MSRSGLVAYLRIVWALGRRSVRNTFRHPQYLAPIIVFPSLFLAINTAGAGRAVELPHFPEVHGFLDFQLAAGILQSTLLAAVQGGIGLALDIEVGFADRLLGRLIDRLRRVRIWNRALVVVVADHGIAFNRGADRRTVTPRNIGALAPVPLFVKLPRERRGELVDRHVESIDIFPTILKVAHLPVPRHLDARSLLHPPARQRRWVTDYHRIGTRLDTVGGRYVFSVARVSRARHAELRRKLRLFGSGGGAEPARLFRVGPYPRLVGRPVAQLRRLPRRLPVARIDQARQLRKVDPRSGFVPGEITGTLPGSTRPGSAVAVAVNGRIEAVGRSFVLAGSRVERFAFVVPSWSLRPGRNAVRVYEVVRAGRALRPL
jgi:hypothetical protein